MTKNSNPSELDENIYEVSPKTKRLVFLLAFFVFAIGLTFRFSLKNLMTVAIKEKIEKVKGRCPFNYQDIDLGFFSTHIKNLEISSRCLSTSQDLKMDELIISWGFPSFSPLGLKLNITPVVKKKELRGTQFIIAPFGWAMKIDKEEISFIDYTSFFSPIKVSGTGDFQLDLRGSYSQEINSFSLSLNSQNILIPSQNINGFLLGNLKIGKANIKIIPSKDEKKIEIYTFELGEKKKDLFAQISGDLEINKKNIGQSKMDFKLKGSLSQEIIQQFPLVELLLGRYKTPEGEIKMSIAGRLNRPTFSPL